jgi:hypothetical protein
LALVVLAKDDIMAETENQEIDQILVTLKRRNWALITTNFLEKLLVTENIKNSIPRLELDEQVAIFQLRDKAKGLLYSLFFNNSFLLLSEEILRILMISNVMLRRS